MVSLPKNKQVKRVSLIGRKGNTFLWRQKRLLRGCPWLDRKGILLWRLWRLLRESFLVMSIGTLFLWRYRRFIESIPRDEDNPSSFVCQNLGMSSENLSFIKISFNISIFKLSRQSCGYKCKPRDFYGGYQHWIEM